ncbi:MAG: N-acetylmuramoyl-L-alanine amidase [Bacilli bacterium]|nr:N-acetylmuramoyl-L-alanine amidase [Bacilli bacterium]
MKKIFIIITLILIITGCKSTTSKDLEKTDEVFNFTDNILDSVDIDVYSIYGRFFNISGILKTKDNYKVVLKNNELEKEFDIYINDNSDKITFQTSKLINEGINLEEIEPGTYIVFLKNNDTYYNLKNVSNYKNLEYYTITQNGKNRKITIEFTKILDVPYLILNCIDEKLPSDVYDIVIDPGHGGKDIGASYKDYTESKFNLEYALKLKEELESLGLKVKLTRETDKSLDNYGEKGRVSIPYITKAKLMLSLHLNSAKLNVGKGGVEIYIANNSNIDFAKKMAESIVEKTGTIFSTNSSDRVASGVYLRKLTKSDLDELKKEAERDGYTPYEKATTSSTYYYIIREIGGIVTGSYIDGRNKKKPSNPYYNSNHGCESYLVELGYISSDTNLDLLINKKDKYIEAIKESIKNELNIK